MNRPTLHLYSVFHLNLAYSAIGEDQRPEVIERCYWPLLRLAAELNLPLGIEASGYTLECLATLDPKWVQELRRLCTDGPCEFVGSGYSQLIGPLVPAAVNAANQRLGMKVYRHLLGLRPRLALVGEQAYSAGLLQHHLDCGYEAIVMEWENPAAHHGEWDAGWRYLPQRAQDPCGRSLPLLWNHSITFQKFQRYAHGETGLAEYLAYLETHLPGTPTLRALCLYGNDVEVFDFRPGRFHTEAELGTESEWERIRQLFVQLAHDERFHLVAPAALLGLLEAPGGGHGLHLESSDQPVPTKKQHKYNVTRWGLSGRGDLAINSACWRIHTALSTSSHPEETDWKELCYLWSSDFRTHITAERWQGYTERLCSVAHRLGVKDAKPRCAPDNTGQLRPRAGPATALPPRDLHLATPTVQISVDPRKGLAVRSLVFPAASAVPLCGTLPHGYYDDIGLGADFFTGHLVMETPGSPKVTDLGATLSVVHDDPLSPHLVVSGTVQTPLGPVHKKIRAFRDRPRVEFEVQLDWDEVPLGSLRLGYVTINPEAFERGSLFYRTHNGGFDAETFPLPGRAVDHGRAVSFLVSARQAVGLTEGLLEIGDRNKVLRVEVDKTAAALLGMVTYRELGGTCFCRLALSAQEMDETSRSGEKMGKLQPCRTFRYAITAVPTGVPGGQ